MAHRPPLRQVGHLQLLDHARTALRPEIDTNAGAPSTWHSLGGVPMGDAADLAGRVLGHKGLYVLDGARLPGSTGACNPSMTIAALAEHSMRTIVQQNLGRVF
ncbi:GMC oxidoreductase [Streptomyces sp. NPDC050549]|uniref:GMC oxidoreductase n=1 Tax=Streptomyces sp. NPDC050549 TaxID=3155406 RepID=UPI0034231D15